MKVTVLVGVILIAVGLLGLIQGGLTYYSNRNVVDLGGLRIQVDEMQHLPLSPVLGTVAILAGAYLLFDSRRGRDRQP